MYELIVDSFAGGGGASTGIRLALGREPDIAINHDTEAILMHTANHPNTQHFTKDIWAIDPVEVCKGQPVALAWFSPDCKHFSKAKGGKPVSKKIRGLAWVAIKWAKKVHPRVIILENVEEFRTWGPVGKDGRPIKEQAGTIFQHFIKQLRKFGYVVDWRELRACDYGAPTSRKRFFLVARCDGGEIVWPDPTHGNPESLEVQHGLLKPWRTAAEVIEWTRPCPSIFDSKEQIKDKYGLNAVRPLKENTLRRIIRGVDKFSLKTADPFIISYKYNNENEPVGRPLSTITTVGSHLLATPSLIQYHSEQTDNFRGQGLTEPIMTVDAANRYGLSIVFLSEYFGNAQAGLEAREPMHTVTSKDREGLTLIHVQKYFGGNYTGFGSGMRDPLGTVTAIDHNALCYTQTTKYQAGTDLHYWPKIRALLNEYCGYNLTDDEIILLWIDGVAYFISDIGLRMLAPRELFDAQGFPHNYIIDVDAEGKSYPRSAQVARCGNAVCPPLAEALVRANLPELCRMAA